MLAWMTPLLMLTWENGTIHAVLPRLKDDGRPTERDNATLVLYTASTTSRVVIDGVDAVESQDPNDQAAGPQGLDFQQ